MFSGNAKTHFQVLGRNENSTGYMMSPFGDDRWDLDDSEKLKKIFKNGSLRNLETKPSYTLQSSAYSSQQSSHLPNPNYGPSYQSVKPPHYGYIHQSETARGYIPKTEVVQMSQSPQVQAQSQQCVYQNSLKDTSRYQHAEPIKIQPVQTVHGVYQSPEVSVYRPLPATKHFNGLNQDEIRHRSRVMRPVQSNYQEHVTQSLPQISNNCGRCHCSQPSLASSNSMSQNHWKTSPDVPLWIAGRTGYQPFGPSEATPNPFFPPQEMTEYIPLK